MTDFIHIENYRRMPNMNCPLLDRWVNRAAVITFHDVIGANKPRREDEGHNGIDITFIGGSNQLFYFSDFGAYQIAMSLLTIGLPPDYPGLS